MFTWASCTKPTPQEDEEEAHESGMPRAREPTRSLTTQFKDMAIKFSGSSRHFRSCTGSSSSTTDEVEYPYMAGVSSSPTHGWELGGSSNNPAGSGTTFMGGHQTPRVHESSSVSEIMGAGVGDDQTPRVHEPSSVSEIVEEDLQGGEISNEWVAQVEPGVQITLLPIPEGGNELKRIRFSRDIFNRWQSQRWWVENYDKIIVLYNVQRISRQDVNSPPTTDQNEQREAAEPPLASIRRSPMSSSFREWAQVFENEASGQQFEAGSSSSMTLALVRNESEVDAEWIEQDQPGVFITVRRLEDGTKELRRIRFSRQIFGEGEAKAWWDKNRDRVHAQYL